MTIDIRRTYSQILEDRRRLRLHGISPNLAAEARSSGDYKLELRYGDSLHYCIVEAGTDDHTDFMNNRLAYCNILERPGGVLPASKNFNDSSTWADHGKNWYSFEPSPGKELVVHNVMGKIDKLTEFPSGHKLCSIVWQGAAEVCPDVVEGTPTAYSGLGWFNVTQAHENDQFFQEYAYWSPADLPADPADIPAYLATNPPKYAARAYEYNTPHELLVKPNFEGLDEEFFKIDFPFNDLFVDVLLRSSMKERIEVFYLDGANNDTPVKKSDGQGGLTASSIYSAIQLRGVEWIEW